jgi:ABC-type branched-subunit amino acid transport system substrate-binding protein
LLAVLVLAGTGDFAASQHREQSQPTLAPIVIGVSNVQSGPSSRLGQKLLEGSRAYFDIVNHAGGIHGRQIEMVMKDDRYEPDPAVQNTNDLITKDNVFFLFDYVGTPTLTRVLPLLKYYEDQQIVNVAPFTGADPQRKPPFQYPGFLPGRDAGAGAISLR